MKKTILISLGKYVEARIYALIHDSIVDRLTQDQNLRIVLVTPDAEIESNLREKFENGNVIIERYSEQPRQNVFQRAFHFFYSYLIYTPTTRLVSSYGVRADKPRPLWRYWNYPFKWIIANSFGKSKWIKTKLIPQLYFYVFPKRSYKYLFERYHPDLVFLTNACIWDVDFAFLVEAKRWKIATIGIPGNWDHLSKYFLPFKPDRLLVWSEQVKREALNFQGYLEDSIQIIGAPYVDFFLRKETLESRREFLKKMSFPRDAKLVSYFSQGPYSLDGPDLVNMILNMIEDESMENVRIVIRVHPRAIFEKEKYIPFRDNPLIYIDEVKDLASVDSFKYYANLLFHSDVVVTTYSSVAAEGSIFDRPTIIAGFDGYKKRPLYQSVRRHRNFTHFQDVLATGGVREVKSQDEFLSSIKEYLAYPERDREERAALRKEIFGYADGQNTQRLHGEVLKFLKRE
jgi:hypothetical protein